MTACNAYAIAATLLERMVGELATARAGVPELAAVQVNPRPLIEFCDEAWVSVVSVRPTSPEPLSAYCATQWMVQLNAGVHRACYPQTEDNSRPDAALIDSAVRDMHDDAEAVRRALAGAFTDDDLPVSLGTWQPIGPTGGGFGGFWTATVTTDLGQMSDAGVPLMPGDPRAGS